MEETIKHILSLKPNKEIEHATATISFEEGREIIKHLAAGLNPEKIAPILAGLPLEFFPYILEEHLPFFKKVIGMEALQHKLIILGTEISKALATKANALLEQEKRLRNLSPALLFDQCHPALTQISDEVHYMEITTHTLLELAWISERPDFIELCSQVREHLVHLQLYLESLKKTLKERLDDIFGLDDATNAIEGLASMGLLYPEDWRIFLKEIGEKVETLSDQKLTKKMNETLSKKGLRTIKDLKDNNLYTYNLLIHFLKNVQKLPQT